MDDTDLDDIRTQPMHHQTVLEGPDGMCWTDWRVAPLVVFSWQLGLHIISSCQGGDPERELHSEEKISSHKMGYLLFEGWDSADKLMHELRMPKTVTSRMTNVPDPIALCEDCHDKAMEEMTLPPHDLLLERHRWTGDSCEHSTSIIKFKPEALGKMMRAIP